MNLHHELNQWLINITRWWLILCLLWQWIDWIEVTMTEPVLEQFWSAPVHRRPTQTSRNVSRLALQITVKPARSRCTCVLAGSTGSPQPNTVNKYQLSITHYTTRNGVCHCQHIVKRRGSICIYFLQRHLDFTITCKMINKLNSFCTTL